MKGSGVNKVALLILILVLIYIGVCIFYYIYQEKVIFYPEVLDPGYQYDYQGNFVELNYYPAQDVILNALHFKAKSAKGLVLYFHGNAGSLATWGDVAPQFLDNGYDLLIYDYRGYGKSRGKLSQQNMFTDAQYIYDKLKTTFEEDKIILYGRSIGSGIAVNTAVSNKPGKLILESPFYSLQDLARKLFPVLPPFLLKYPMRNDKKITRVKCPVYLFHGTEDDIIYFGSSLKLKKLQPENITLYPIRDGGHNNLVHFEDYHKYLAKILE